MAHLFIPQSLKADHLAYPLEMAVGATVAEALADLGTRHAGAIDPFWREGMLRPGFFIIHNQRVLDPDAVCGLRLAQGDQVRIVQPLSGG
ncbi:MoaD/ThiS family protein [Herbaspirillum sp. SJZ107]|uniref:MoaD/ThiS family protein n=1 Tax=Herbaspirillum sp. SJZ107 TaxID=2572881 RepID=UPI00116825AF|nr:MoaD/ThiS family protein [Herbaspirillum sp. SJZ107]TQK03367.1 ThiS family protein [Herbaspirillum sp. SJZ107]